MENSFRIESAAVSDRGLSEKRPQNEDSFLEINQKGIFAVADGVGGAQAGEVASQMAVEILGEAFTNRTIGSDAEQMMRAALVQANSAIHQMSNDLEQLSKMATTVVALHIEGNIATIGHVGDSRLYRLDSAGTIHRETDDHSMVGEEVRAGRMTEEQAENHPSRNIISRALGAEATVQIDLKTIMIESNSTFLLCSDGVTRHIRDAELAELLVLPETTDDICLRIKEICYDRGAEDNLTAVIVKLTASGGSETQIADNRADFLSVPDYDEVTVASARKASIRGDFDEDDDLLELDTAELKIPAEFSRSKVVETVKTDDEIVEDLSLHETIPVPIHYAIPKIEEENAPEIEPAVSGEEIEIIKEPAIATAPAKDERFSMFGETSSDLYAEPEPSALGKFASYLGILLVGGLIGLGVYHFALKPVATEGTPPITEMRSGNIPLSAFEDNRREVDKDPAGYISKTPPPEDADDFYLQGRAHMLTGDYVKARAAFIEARNRIAKADPVNARVIASDIAIAMAVTNDTAAQKILKAEIDTAQPSSNINSNVNK